MRVNITAKDTSWLWSTLFPELSSLRMLRRVAWIGASESAALYSAKSAGTEACWILVRFLYGGQFPNDMAALKTLWLMICNIEHKRAAQRAKKAKRDIECNGYIEGAKTNGWKQAINQLAAASPDRFAEYL